MGLFEKKWVLITGASSGIGKAFAIRLASEGANLVLVARHEDVLNQLAKGLSEQHHIKTFVIPQDLSHAHAPEAVFHATQDAHITIDVLINNAGFGVYGKLHETSLECNQEMLMLNIMALSSLTQLFLPPMVRRHAGIIINISSIAGFFPLPYFANYAASKAFVLSFTEALWGEYKKEGIQFLCVCPSSTATQFFTVAGLTPGQEKLDSPEQVVEQTLKALKKNRIYVLCGSIRNYIAAQLPRIFTHQFLVKTLEPIMKRRSK